MTKRPVTIFGCSTDQKNECDYKYLARVWFYRSAFLFIVSIFGTACGGIWFVNNWKNKTEGKVEFLTFEISSAKDDIKNIKAISHDLDSLKSWIRPKE
jgi:hypothetical protein